MKKTLQMIERAMRMPNAEDYPTIEPGASLTYRWRPKFPGNFVRDTWHLLKPGGYRISATYFCEERHTAWSPHASGIWLGRVTSNEVVLKVEVGDAE
jgi:hypothetical protein